MTQVAATLALIPSSIAILVSLAALALLLAALARSAGRLDLRRSVLIHVPLAGAWTSLRNVPWLIARHVKTGGHGGIDEWVLREGDGERAGSVWRGMGRWGGVPYWADVEIAILRPGRQVAIALVRDSLGTHRTMREHLGSLTLEESGPGTTKATWRLRARLAGVRLRVQRVVFLRTLKARLLDLSLRSIKSDLEREFALEGESLLRRPDGHDDRSARPADAPLRDGTPRPGSARGRNPPESFPPT